MKKNKEQQKYTLTCKYIFIKINCLRGEGEKPDLYIRELKGNGDWGEGCRETECDAKLKPQISPKWPEACSAACIECVKTKVYLFRNKSHFKYSIIYSINAKLYGIHQKLSVVLK